MTVQTFDSTLPFMPESESEVARQLLLHHKLSDYMGGPLPSVVDLEHVHDVLDVACGVGGWVSEMASLYPSLHLVGIDTSAFFLEQARSYIGDKEQVTLQVADMHRLEEQFAPQSFDLMHLRFLAGEVTCKRFPELLQSLGRLCRTGGFMVWTEAELPETNSQACCLLESALLCALLQADRAFWNGYRLRLGLTLWMETWLRQAGCEIELDEERTIDVSAGTDAHAMFVRQMWVCGHQVRPFVLGLEVLTASEYEQVFAQMLSEIRVETFRGSCSLRTIVAYKL